MKPAALLRQARTPAVVVAGYLILRAVFDTLSEQHGLVSPNGSVSAGVAVLGAAVILLRLAVLFAVPALVAYRLVAALVPVAPRGGASPSQK